MFGYIQANVRELKLREYEVYRSYYCGLCQALKQQYGRRGQILLNYDMTFLAILLTGLYEPEETMTKQRCLPHPVRKHPQIHSEAVDYAADMTILLAYQKALDDWRDENSHLKRGQALLLYDDYRKLREKWPRQARCLERCVRELSRSEEEGDDRLDFVAGLTGEFLAEMFVWREDIWARDLRGMGFYLGKFIYLMDAFDDLERDEKKGNYNLMLSLREQDPEQFDENARLVMEDMMTQSARCFERLPVVEQSEILRNILYSGVWVRYAAAVTRRNIKKGKKEKNDEKSL